MIVDSSAIIGILFDEEDADRLLLALSHHECRMSAASFVEIGIVLDTRGAGEIVPDQAQFLRKLGIHLEPVTVEQSRIARDAHRRFGRRSGHAARLNFGDCFVYALAKETGEPILCKGNDFAQTDALIASY